MNISFCQKAYKFFPNKTKFITNASDLINYLQAKGIDRESICQEHLMPVYNKLSKSNDSPFGLNIQIPGLEIPKKTVNDDVWGVIVETRKISALEYVVCQFSEQLGITIQLFHSKDNESYIKSSKISGLIEEGKVKLTLLQIDKFRIEDYNALFLSRKFWDALWGRKKILVFQTDAILCSQSDYKLSDFNKFDYIGSKTNKKRPVGLIINGGSGGLSLRDWQKSVDCLKVFPSDLWSGGEDGYFAFHLELMGGKVANPDECSKFSTQDYFLYKSFGGHKLSLLNSSAQKKFIQYCPEVKNIMPLKN